MDQHADIAKPAGPRRWRAQAALTVAAWPIAFLVVIAVSTVFDNAFASLPRPLRALVLSGVVVAVMVNLVMPTIGAGLARRLPTSPDTKHRPDARESERR